MDHLARDPSIADIQNLADTRGLALQKVGIRGLRHPIQVRLNHTMTQAVLASFDLSVNLPAELKGTHMSRFVEILHAFDQALDFEQLSGLLQEMQTRLQTRDAFLEVTFPVWRLKKSPVSHKQSGLDYEISWRASASAAQKTHQLIVQVPVTTLCPCSKAISRYGAHNQRSLVRATLNLKGAVDILRLIDLIEAQSSCELYGLLKRVDEKYITERAYENPKFVEDLVRDIALALRPVPEIQSYSIEAENMESIHNHSAFAVVEAHNS